MIHTLLFCSGTKLQPVFALNSIPQQVPVFEPACKTETKKSIPLNFDK